ncbi:hypothetical protein QTP86_026493, partial [Hemibagrus guttatus]
FRWGALPQFSPAEESSGQGPGPEKFFFFFFVLVCSDSRSAHVSVGGVAPRCSFRGAAAPPVVSGGESGRLPPLEEFQSPARQTSSPRSRCSLVDVARCECSAVDVARSCCSAVDVARSCCSAVDVARSCCSAVVVARSCCSAVVVARSCCSAVVVARSCCSAVVVARSCFSAVVVVRLCCSAVDVVRRLRSAVDVASDPLALPSGPLLPPLASLLLLTPPTCLALVLLPPTRLAPASRSPHRPLYVPSSSPGPIAGQDFWGRARDFKDGRGLVASEAGTATGRSAVQLPTSPSDPTETVYANMKLPTSTRDSASTASMAQLPRNLPDSSISTFEKPEESLIYTTVRFHTNATGSDDAAPKLRFKKEEESCEYATVSHGNSYG